ncbi:MAG: 2Fe-2S iron-sulfur cluster binding domain-containing protein, partial [Verrucomicrobia bacterium]
MGGFCLVNARNHSAISRSSRRHRSGTGRNTSGCPRQYPQAPEAPVTPTPATPSRHASFCLNGKPVGIGNADPNRTLLEALRDAGLTGAKEGCNEGDCGACAVVVSLPDADGIPRWRSVNSCILPLAAMAGREVRTVEGLAMDRPDPAPDRSESRECPASLHPIQSALVRHHGSQCGYCTPGIVMSLVEACHRRDLATEEDLAEQLAGNLCRCTGYRSIRAAAIEALEAARRGCGLVPAPAPSSLPLVAPEAPDGGFFHPEDLRSLFAIRERFPAARWVAGGTDLGPEITRKFHRFEALVSLEHVRELAELRATPDAWHIGAAVPLTVLAERLAGELPEVDAMIRGFGSRQIRNRATLGGNLATASPVACAATLLLAMDARLVLASATGERVVGIDEFFTGYRTTVLRPD